MMEYDLWISGYKDPYTEQLCNLGVKNGIITYTAPFFESSAYQSIQAAETISGAGRLLLSGLVESHIHLDKSFLSSQLQQNATSLTEAISFTAELKKDYTIEDIINRSVVVIERSIQAGVTHLRCQVEIDPIIQLKSLEAALYLKKRYSSMITLQLVAFPQEGIFNQPGTQELMQEAVNRGVDVIGGIPYNDRDPLEHLEWIFQLAKSNELPLDIHVDFSDDPSDETIVDIIRLTEEYGLQGKVAVAHLTSLGSMELPKAEEIAKGLANAQISVMTLPATDLYLNGRGDTVRPRRGLTPVQLLLENGVNVCFGTNNIRNAFTPFGNGDPLDIAFLLAQTAYLGTEEDAKLLLEMCTTRAAKAIGLNYPGIVVGAPADFVLVDATKASHLIYDRTADRIVWKNGVRVAEANTYRYILAPDVITY
ncbi:MAG TPA: amidohydrolase family protein [Ureibacillus sp.]|nr:amidohydrolase family protein [Ureibacillus sp.]